MSFFFVAALGVALHWATYLNKLRVLIPQTRDRQTEILPCSPSDVPGLDLEKLEAATCELQVLGFQFLEDHASRPVKAAPENTPPIADPMAAVAPVEPFKPQGMARVFVHRELGCLAKVLGITVIKTATNSIATTSFSVAIVSLSGSGENPLSYSTSNRVADATNDALMMLTRRPQSLSTRVPGASIEAVFKIHLERRDDLARAAGIGWNKSITLADDYLSEKLSSENIRRVYGALNPFSMAWKIFISKRKPLPVRLEWLGDFAGQIPTVQR